MKKILLLVLYGVGAGLFAGFFPAPLYHVLAVLFFAGFAVLVFSGRIVPMGPRPFSGRWPRQNAALEETFWLLSFFLWLANIFGFLATGLNFTLGIFLVFLAAFLVILGGLPVSTRRRAFVYGFSGALIAAEFFWAAAFLPFGYLTLSGLVFVVFYLIWTLLHHHLWGNLNLGIIFKNLAFGAALFAILLLSARWQP